MCTWFIFTVNGGQRGWILTYRPCHCYLYTPCLSQSQHASSLSLFWRSIGRERELWGGFMGRLPRTSRLLCTSVVDVPAEDTGDADMRRTAAALQRLSHSGDTEQLSNVPTVPEKQSRAAFIWYSMFKYVNLFFTLRIRMTLINPSWFLTNTESLRWLRYLLGCFRMLELNCRRII